jgi:hypothetical protein
MQARTAEVASADKARQAFPAPLFRELTERLGREQRRVLLELGCLMPGTLALLEGFRCCLFVVDAGEVLEALSRESEEPDWFSEQVTAAFPHIDEPVDAVFCWDLLNYLSPPVLGALGRELSRIVKPGGFAHALIHVAPTMPERPGRYSVESTEQLVCNGLGAVTRRSPRYTPWDLEKHCASLKLERSVMLRNGMQEYLLRIEPQGSGPREIPALYRSR